MNKLLYATYNNNKVAEIQDILDEFDTDIDLVSLNDFDNVPEFVENETTFLENAKVKAHRYSEFSGIPTLAESAGLCVDHLNGAPGVFSYRYAGQAYNDARNNAKLLAAMGGVRPEKRNAQLYTALVISWPNYQDDLISAGTIKGEIMTYPHGEQNYGYDPLFMVPEMGKTLGEMSIAEKNSISHRGQAFTKMVQELPMWWDRHVSAMSIER